MVATDPRMYNYFHVSDEALKIEMVAATTFVVSKTSASLRVLKNVVDCALIEGCMGPSNATVFCNTEVLWKGEYANCHRYDQSALALSLAQCSSNIEDYQGVSDILAVQRFSIGGKKDLQEAKKKFPWMNRVVL